MCIWQMSDRLMLTNVHWLVLHDWIKPAGCKQPDSKLIYKGRRALTEQKMNKSDCINITLGTTSLQFHLQSQVFHDLHAKNICIFFIQHVEKPVQRVDEECHWQALSSRVISKSQLDLKWPQKWPTVSPSTTWVKNWISQNSRVEFFFLQPTLKLLLSYEKSPAVIFDMVFVSE